MYDDDRVFCSNNDAIFSVTMQSKSKADRLWEKDFAQKLKEGPYPVFHDIGKCAILMTTQDAGEPPLEAGGISFGETKSASVFLTCKQGSFDDLSTDAINYLSETLLTAYSKSHDADEVMSNMEWNSAVKTPNGMAFTADWGCHKCEGDKKAYLRGKDNKRWADYFVHNLQDSPFPALKDLNKCKISSMFEAIDAKKGEVTAEAVAEAARNA